MGAISMMQSVTRATFTTKLVRRLTYYVGAISKRLEILLRRRQLEDAALRSAEQIHTHMSAAELNVLYDLAAGLPESSRAIEIGSYIGASATRLAAGLSLNGGQLYCVDTWANETMPEGERDTFAEFQRNTAAVSSRIKMVRKRSDELNASEFEIPLDFAFIDADHSYAAVAADIKKVGEWLKDGGIVAFHDCTYFEGVSRVLGEILATGQWQLLGNVDSLVWLKKLGLTGSFPNPMSADERRFVG